MYNDVSALPGGLPLFIAHQGRFRRGDAPGPSVHLRGPVHHSPRPPRGVGALKTRRPPEHRSGPTHGPGTSQRRQNGPRHSEEVGPTTRKMLLLEAMCMLLLGTWSVNMNWHCRAAEHLELV